MEGNRVESVPTHEQTNTLPLATRQTLYNWHQSQAGNQMEAEWLAQQEQSQRRARFVALFNPCGVE